ncbi:MAG: hypothetical protein AAGC49_09510 [Brevundimonas sp.]
MIVPVALLVGALSLALASWATWFVVVDRAVILRQLWGGAVVEAALLVQAVIAAIVLVTGDHELSAGLFWAYVVAQLVVLPIAAAWAFAERTRWSSVVLLVASLTVAFLELRLWQIWENL